MLTLGPNGDISNLLSLVASWLVAVTLIQPNIECL